MKTLINVYGITSAQLVDTELSIQFGRSETAVVLDFNTTEAAQAALNAIEEATKLGASPVVIESIS